MKATARGLIVSIFLLLAACATTPRPLTGIVPGRELETLQSSVHVNIRQGKSSRGGRGYLVFQRPDRFHLVILSPFGQSLFEIYSDAAKLVCLYPSEKVAYRGSISDLPEGVRLWGLMRWVVERVPTGLSAGERENITSEGRHERVGYDERGLAVRRVDGEGNRVVYRDYGSVDGIAFPLGMEIADQQGATVTVTFDEPELNRPLEEGVLDPPLEAVRVFPLSALAGLM